MRVRNLALVIVAIVIGVAVWWRAWRGGEVAAGGGVGSAAQVAVGSGSARGTASASARVPAAPPSIRRITEDQRRQIAAQIAEARARRARAGSDASGALDAGSAERRIAVEHVSAPVKSALEEAIPILAECYVRTGKRQARPAVMMTLIGDPAVGTLIEPTEMFDHEHKPLDPALDRCLRDTFATLELPPLDEGDRLDIQYSFRFDD